MTEQIKVMTVFGTRPEAIKMAPLVKALEQSPHIRSIVCVTAQHRQMLDQVLRRFDITPDYDLDIMKEKQTLSGITTKALMGLEEVMNQEKPHMVLVHGDTTTTFAGALAAFYTHTRVGHVEAGLRTYDKWSPFPEEMNRQLTTSLTDLYFAPTENNRQNLLREQINPEVVYVTGNTVIDALKTTVEADYQFRDPVLQSMDFQSRRVIVVTAHRRENLGEPLQNICRALKTIVETHDDVELVYPVHLNPLVRETVFEILGNVDRVKLIDPLDVEELHNLMARCYMVMTDSGGLQEEAPSLGKPVLVLRNETERPEAVECGTVKMAGVQYQAIVDLACELLEQPKAYAAMSKAVNPYGDGAASERIVQAILYYFGKTANKPKDFRV